MTTVTIGGWTVDYAEAGDGPVVILIHSSVSGNRQWRKLVTALSGRHRVVALNLFGYGKNTPWPADRMQIIATS